jgi:four helix bundle protein
MGKEEDGEAFGVGCSCSSSVLVWRARVTCSCNVLVWRARARARLGAGLAVLAAMAPRASEPSLDHERLDVYQVAVALDALVCGTCRAAPRGHASLSDQALRASASVVLNIAEANGREGLDRARCLRIARGSANELDAALTLMSQRGTLNAASRAEARELSVRVVSMLVRWVRTLQAP